MVLVEMLKQQNIRANNFFIQPLNVDKSITNLSATHLWPKTKIGEDIVEKDEWTATSCSVSN